MKILTLALKSLQRDWRSGELGLIAVAILIAVTSLTSVNFFTDRVRNITEHQATELLAADLVLQSRDPLPDEVLNSARAAGLLISNTVNLRSMVAAGDELHMAEVKAVDNTYPIRGQLRITDNLFGEELTTNEIPEPGTVWTDSRLFQLLGLEIGSHIRLGAAEFKVTKILSYEPDRGGDVFNIAPRLLMNLADLDQTGLILPASRVEYNLLLGGTRESIAAFRGTIRSAKELRVQGIREARPELRSALERAEQFLGLAALVSIALSGLAIAMSTQRYVIRHFDNCAIMRCLGAEQHTIAGIYFLQLLILAVLSSLLGCGAGYLAQELLTRMLTGVSGSELPGASFTPVFQGLGAGIITVLGFAMPQILRLRAVTPLRVLRRDLSPVPVGGVAGYGFAIIALALLTPWQSGNIRLTAYAFSGMLLTAAVLAIGAAILVRSLNKLRSRVGVAYRFGLANVARRAGQSIAQIVGIGIGVMVMLLLTLVKTDMLDNWRNRLPEGTPNYFLINIQAEDVPELKSFLEIDGRTTAELFPMLRARLTAINNRRLVAENFSDQESRRWLTRDYNLSWSGDLPAANRVTQGRWWSGTGATEALFSVETSVSGGLGLNTGDMLTFLIAGEEISGRIANIREVEWDSFNVNFFVLANPGTLDTYPASYITSFFLPPGNRDLIIDLVKNFPSVTVFDLDALMTEVRKIMDQVIRTVEFVFGFTVLAGMIVLIAALQTTHDERASESALLSAIGARRRQILSSLTAEFLCIGLITGILAAFSATAVEVILAKFVFNMDIVINFRVWIIAPLISTAVIVLGGLAGTWRVLYTPPVVALRQN